MSTFDQPRIKAKTPINRELLVRLCRCATPGEVEHPKVPGYILKNEDFFAPVIVVQEAGTSYTTFLNDRFFDAGTVKDGLKAGARIVCSVPDPQSSSGSMDVAGTVTQVHRALGFEWLEAQIKAGAIPAVLSQTHITFDVTASVQVALELGAVIWNWPNMAKIVEKPIPDNAGDHTQALQAMQTLVGHHLSMSKPMGRKEDDEIFEVALIEIQNIIKKVYSATGNIHAVTSMLPLCTIVTATVTKSILDWRTWLQSRSECYETAWIKSFLFKKLSDSLGPLFIGCGVAVQMLDEFKAE